MEFTEEQQAHIDKLINKRIAEVKSKAEAKAQGELEKLRAEIETLQKAKGESNERIKQALLKAEVAQTRAVDVNAVMKLVSEYIVTAEDGELAVIDGEGTVRLDEAGNPYHVKDFVEDYLADNPYLAKVAPTRGSGSIGATPYSEGRTMRRADFDNLDAARKTDYIQGGGKVAD